MPHLILHLDPTFAGQAMAVVLIPILSGLLHGRVTAQFGMPVLVSAALWTLTTCCASAVTFIVMSAP